MVPAADVPTGVYGVGGGVLRVRLIAARELPRERSTLLVRLMAAGPLFALPQCRRRSARSSAWSNAGEFGRGGDLL